MKLQFQVFDTNEFKTVLKRKHKVPIIAPDLSRMTR